MPSARSLAPLDVAACRRQFPALERRHEGQPVAYLDGPAGSQVPRRVIDAVSDYLAHSNANSGGRFTTSLQTDERLAQAHAAVADLLGTRDPDTVVFGANTTTNLLGLSRALARTWSPGDEVLVTRLDHDANVTPWVLAARDAGAVVRHVEVRSADCTLDVDGLGRLIGPRTRLVAVGCASNAVGTINPFRDISRLAHEAGALVLLDAVHYAPHALVDVEEWGCDFAVCSAYKFFGPHVGVLWGRRELLESIEPYKLRPAPNDLPGRWMTGTLSHEGIVGVAAAVEYLADLGRSVGAADAGRRDALRAAYEAIRRHEQALTLRLLEALAAVRGVRVWGITNPKRIDERLPTVALSVAGRAASAVADHLNARGIYAWHGNFYALALSESLGLEPEGMVRVGLLHYNTADEVDRLVAALGE
jgi:cysteine desulfurase family protein (TIGR01976 family)